MHFLAAIEGQDGIHVLVIDPFAAGVVQKHPVGGEGDFQHLTQFSSTFVAIFYNSFAHVHVEQWFPTKEVHFYMCAMLAGFHQKVDGFLAHFQAHQRTTTAIGAAVCKAIAAAQVAVMRHVQAQSFDDRFGVWGKIAEIDVAEQQSLVDQFSNAFGNVLGILLSIHSRRLGNGILPCLPFLEGIEEGVNGFVSDMDGAAVDVEHQMQIFKYKTMNT